MPIRPAFARSLVSVDPPFAFSRLHLNHTQALRRPPLGLGVFALEESTRKSAKHLPLADRFKGVPKVLDLGRPVVVGPDDRHHVEPAALFEQVPPPQKP